MKHVGEFQKLFKINFPVEQHHEYYIDVLKGSKEFEGLDDLIEEFEQYTKDVEKLGYSSPRSYKLDYALPKMKQYIIGTPAYGRLLGQTFESTKYRTKDELRNNDGEFLLSIDFKAANFNTLKAYDEESRLNNTWEGLCNRLNVHPTLAKSKSFRQYVFGNTNPKRLQKVQHINMLSIIGILQKNNILKEEDIVFISHDEFIVRLPKDIVEANDHALMLFAQVENLIDIGGVLPMPVHKKIMRLTSIGKQMCVQEIFDFGIGSLILKYKTLFKVPGNKYFKYFKKHILETAIDLRDLMFMNDGEIAVWAEDEDFIESTITPEGEITLEEAKQNYEMWFNRLIKEVPGIKESQVRKIIDISLQLCQHCHNEEADKCHCWKY